MIQNDTSHPDVAAALNRGKLVVAKTDTIYGILARAADPEATKNLYSVRHRSTAKGCIMLVADIHDIPNLTDEQKKTYLALHAERPTTIVTSVDDSFYPHLVRQNGTLALRLITDPDFAALIRTTGPLLAPSANPEGLSPATNVKEAMDYFGDAVAVYVHGGTVTANTPSRIVTFTDGALEILR